MTDELAQKKVINPQLEERFDMHSGWGNLCSCMHSEILALRQLVIATSAAGVKSETKLRTDCIKNCLHVTGAHKWTNFTLKRTCTSSAAGVKAQYSAHGMLCEILVATGTELCRSRRSYRLGTRDPADCSPSS